MAVKKGMVTTCDRCGASVFSALIGKQEFDGGYTTKDKFEPIRAGWNRVTVKGVYTDLCPDCADKWHRIGQDFMEGKE